MKIVHRHPGRTRQDSFLTAFFGMKDIPKKDLVFEREAGARILRVSLLGFYSGRTIFHPRLFKTAAALKPDVVGDLYEN